MQCPDCGHEWERQLSTKITKSAAIGPILSKGEATWKNVARRRFSRHEKFGGKPSVRVDYITELGGNLVGATGATFKEWVPFESDKGRFIAERWWKQHGGLMPVPATTSEALRRAGELRPVSEIRIEPEGKHWRITGRKFAAPAGIGNDDAVDHTDPFAADRAGSTYSHARLTASRAMAAFDAKDLEDDVPF
jgi:DNA repair protein RadD